MLLGLSEHGKMKFKVILERFGLYEKVYIGGMFNQTRISMLEYHTHYMLRKNLEDETMQNELDAAFSCYKKVTNDQIDAATFKETFETPLGFLIDARDEEPSLTKLAYEIIDQIFPEDFARGGVSARDHMKLSYKEGQLTSHATRYLYYANAAAFKEEENIVSFFDYLIVFTIMRTYHYFQLAWEDVPEKNDRTLVNLLRNTYKRYQKTMEAKAPLYKEKRVKKTDFDTYLDKLEAIKKSVNKQKKHVI